MSDFVTTTASSVGTSEIADSDLSLGQHDLTTNTDTTHGGSSEDHSAEDTEEYTDDDNEDAVLVEENDSQQQWDESMEQLNKVCIFVIFPLLGKFVGKKVANLIWKRIASKIWG